ADHRRSPMRDTKLTSPTLAMTIAATLLAACGGGGSMYTMGGGYTNMPGGGTTMTTPSSITLASPGASVNRTVSLTAMPVAGTGTTVSRVDFLVDGTVVGTATMSPYSIKWDTGTIADGTHSLTAKVTDSAGKMVTSASVSVAVLNKPSFTF